MDIQIKELQKQTTFFFFKPSSFRLLSTYIECLMVIVFGPDERHLNDVQVSSCHCHWGVSTARERGRGRTVTTDGMR